VRQGLLIVTKIISVRCLVDSSGWGMYSNPFRPWICRPIERTIDAVSQGARRDALLERRSGPAQPAIIAKEWVGGG